jgi:hypothetical protein
MTDQDIHGLIRDLLRIEDPTSAKPNAPNEAVEYWLAMRKILLDHVKPVMIETRDPLQPTRWTWHCKIVIRLESYFKDGGSGVRGHSRRQYLPQMLQ